MTKSDLELLMLDELIALNPNRFRGYTRISRAMVITLLLQPEPTIPNGSVECQSCGGSGEFISGYDDGFPRQDRCGRCSGSGYVWPECRVCQDTGEYAVADVYGHLSDMEPCFCAAGQRLQAQQREVVMAHFNDTDPLF